MTKEEFRQYHKQWRKEHPGYYTLRSKMWRQANPERFAELHRRNDIIYQRKKRARIAGYKTEEYRRYRKKNPEKIRAHAQLNYAIKSGTLKRSPCEVCGEGRKYHVHAHHDDYSKPLEVRWLCPIHHKLAHK